jgi:hypothetical protein
MQLLPQGRRRAFTRLPQMPPAAIRVSSFSLDGVGAKRPPRLQIVEQEGTASVGQFEIEEKLSP